MASGSSASTLALVLLFVACTDATPRGAVLLTHDLRPQLPSGLDTSSEALCTHVVSLGLGGSVEFHNRILASGVDRYITEVVIKLVDANGTKVTASAMGTPINSAAADAGVQMQQTFLVSQATNNLTGTRFAETLIRVSADGSVTVL